MSLELDGYIAYLEKLRGDVEREVEVLERAKEALDSVLLVLRRVREEPSIVNLVGAVTIVQRAKGIVAGSMLDELHSKLAEALAGMGEKP